MTKVSSYDYFGNYGSIFYGYPNTELFKNKSVSNHSAVVFFGITYPYYWTDDTVDLFENSVNWLTTSDFTPPATPVLTGQASVRNPTATYEWTSSGNFSTIQYYRFQLSDSPEFNTTLMDENTTLLQFNATGLMDGSTLYSRVNAVNWIDISSGWSNTIKTIVDFSDIFVTINSPADATSAKVGDSISVNATVNSTRPISFCSASIGDQASDLVYENETCSGNVNVPNAASTILTVSATNNLGTTNSSTVSLNIQKPSVPTSSGGGGGGGSGFGSGAAILSVNASDRINVYENSNQEISVSVKNDGTLFIQNVKVSVLEMNATVQPDSVGLDRNKYQDFKITLNVPVGTGEKQITVKAQGYGASATKKIILTVLPQPDIPELNASFELPTFSEDEQTLINISVENTGSAVANVIASMSLPSGWILNEQGKTFEIAAGTNEKISFSVTPSGESGQIIFNGVYMAAGQERQISETAYANSNPNQVKMITGMIASTISMPEFYFPAAILTVVAAILLIKKNSLSKLIQKNKVSHPIKNDLIIPRKKINVASNYLDWERRQRFH